MKRCQQRSDEAMFLFVLFAFLFKPTIYQTLSLLVIADLASSEIFVDKGGFLKWELSQNPVLKGAEDKLEIKFKACNERGLLIYQAGQGQNFFSMGVFNGQIYIEASLSGQLLEMFIGDKNSPPVQHNQTHVVVITNMREHHLGQMTVVVDGSNAPLSVLTDVQPTLSFTDPNLLGNTFIGGYKEVNDLRLQSDRLYNYPIVCISYLYVGSPSREVDLTSTTESTGQDVPTCPVCAPPSIATLRSSRSYMKVEADLQPRSGTAISLKFKTKAKNGLLLYFGGPAWLVVYLKDGKAVLRLNTKGSGADQSYVSTNSFNDGQEQELFIERDANTATMKDRAGNIIGLVTFQGQGADAAHSLSVNSLYVGGFKNPADDLTTDAKQYIEVTESLRGCLEEFRFVSYSSVEETAHQIDFKTATIESRDTTFDQCHELDTCLSKECTGVGQVCNLGVCECKPGWNEQTPGADPLVCIDIDECQSNPCQNGGTCINMENAYRCQCPEQYKGKNCDTERNCYSFPCHLGGTCIEGTSATPSISGRNCTCPRGSSGVSCEDDIDECSLTQNCVTGTCRNLVGSYECTCKVGYHGYLCRNVIDNCANNPCDPGRCYNVIGGFNCTCANDSEARIFINQKCPSSSSSIPAIVGGVVAVLLSLLLLAGLGVFIWRRNKARQAAPTPQARRQDEHRNDLHQPAADVSEPPYHIPLRIMGNSERELSWNDISLSSQLLGSGNFGEVRKGTVKLGGDMVQSAIKVLKSGADQESHQEFQQEVDIMRHVGYHPNIVNLLGTCNHKGQQYMALELAANGDLLKYLRKSRVHMTERPYANMRPEVKTASTLSPVMLLRIACDVASGMEHLAGKNVIHRDLAARNVLLTDSLLAKVADFGLSRGEGIYEQKSRKAIPFRCTAIEALSTKMYTTKSDVWSFGILIWEIVTLGGTPYSGMKSRLLIRRLHEGYRLPKPRNCEDALYHVMMRCWERLPTDRPTFSDLVQVLTNMMRDMTNYINVDDDYEYEVVESGDDDDDGDFMM
ncbi:uncharacterized protein LOC118416664 [Branchiostoma floridae]|uniref:Uncharacterized protein LOC118416664 n=2 Tax=Branchiostoma floridae TaxID=7739 RepID=A0A9J7MSZ6_BRAFL|nr:uncharacterized protein LOC118416664 [Branchiostoma floridae]